MQDRPAGLAAQVTRLAVQDGMTAEALLVHAARSGGQLQGARWSCSARGGAAGDLRGGLLREAHRHVVVQ